jgi:cytochrome P450
MERYKTFCAKQADERTAKQHDMKNKDVWTSLLTAKDPATGQSFTQTDLHSEAAIVVSAASHPMRQTLGALTHYLIENPTCMAHVRAELESAFSHVEDIRSGPGLQKCHYLRACLRETLRMSPGLPGNPLRTVLKGGLTIDGNFYPEGTDMSVSTYTILHNEEYYHKPFSFIPERWLVRPADDVGDASIEYATEEELARANEAFAAFSVGPMACLGKNVVYHQAMLVFARMVWQFDLRRTQSPKGYESTRMGDANAQALHGEYPQRDNFSAEGDGPWVQFRCRV